MKNKFKQAIKILKARSKHRHFYVLHCNPEDMWLQCACGKVEEVPAAKEDWAFDKMRRQDWDWGEKP